MSRQQRIETLRRLQNEAEDIRRELGISAPSAVLYYAALYPLNDQMVLVEADGLGAATTSVIEGNYPLDFVTQDEKSFETEDGAVEAAIALVEGYAKLEALA